MLPPIWSRFVRTMSMPTPRPETVVISALVDRPAMNISSMRFTAREGIGARSSDELGGDRAGGQGARVDAAAVVGQLEAYPPALV